MKKVQRWLVFLPRHNEREGNRKQFHGIEHMSKSVKSTTYRAFLIKLFGCCRLKVRKWSSYLTSFSNTDNSLLGWPVYISKHDHNFNGEMAIMMLCGLPTLLSDIS